MVKNEGVILFAVAIVVAGAALGRRILDFWKPVLGLLAALALRIGYLRWTSVVDMEFGINFSRAYHRIAQLPGAAIPWILRWDDWALYWPAALLACVILLIIGRAAERALAAGLALGVAAYTVLYLFTNWDMALHISNSYPRLLEHLTPVATLSMVAAWGRLSTWAPVGNRRYNAPSRIAAAG
jgi:hypothetical protein